MAKDCFHCSKHVLWETAPSDKVAIPKICRECLMEAGRKNWVQWQRDLAICPDCGTPHESGLNRCDNPDCESEIGTTKKGVRLWWNPNWDVK